MKNPTSSLGQFAVAIGLFLFGYWTFRPSAPPATKEAAAPQTTTPAPSVAASPASAPGAPYANEAAARTDAARLYPELTAPQTQFAQRYAALEAQYRKERPEFFKDPGWPVALAKETAANISAKP